MESFLEKIAMLEEQHDRIDPELIERKRIKLGLRNPDGTGVVVGITTKGQVKAFKRDRHGHNIPIPGKLIYCGIDVEDIVAGIERDGRYGFEETVYLLLTGELPTSVDLESFSRELGKRRSLPEVAKQIISFNSKNDDQMSALHSAVASLHKFDDCPRSTDVRDVTRQCMELIAKFPTIIAYNWKVAQGKNGGNGDFLEPRPELSTAQNFLYMLLGEEPPEEVARAFDICLILHAEHGGGNNSTFTVRTVSSSQTDTFMAISAGVASLAGHLHGGANESVMAMMDGIRENVRDWKDEGEVRRYLEGLMDKRHGDGSGKIYGMGHAVYVVSDPREIILKEKSRKFAEKAGRLEEFDLYDLVGRLAVDVIKERKGKPVCPNVDFYSGFLYDMMGVPRRLFTPVFAMSRVAGWSAHRIEEIILGRLIRPSYISAIKKKVRYKSISKRS
ncbi:MAG: citrate synthase [Nitrospirota bacterium]|jgi:citrate synthase